MKERKEKDGRKKGKRWKKEIDENPESVLLFSFDFISSLSIFPPIFHPLKISISHSRSPRLELRKEKAFLKMYT